MLDEKLLNYGLKQWYSNKFDEAPECGIVTPIKYTRIRKLETIAKGRIILNHPLWWIGFFKNMNGDKCDSHPFHAYQRELWTL